MDDNPWLAGNKPANPISGRGRIWPSSLKSNATITLKVNAFNENALWRWRAQDMREHNPIWPSTAQEITRCWLFDCWLKTIHAENLKKLSSEIQLMNRLLFLGVCRNIASPKLSSTDTSSLTTCKSTCIKTTMEIKAKSWELLLRRDPPARSWGGPKPRIWPLKGRDSKRPSYLATAESLNPW